MEAYSWLLLLTFAGLTLGTVKRPNIVTILADDMGYGDAGYNYGSADCRTPNIDAIANYGRVLNSFYGGPMCTPNRASLMTGLYQSQTTLQSLVIFGAERKALPLDFTIWPQYFKKLGYKNYLVGKWHLGHYKKEYTPTLRGFDYHSGFWLGKEDYYTHKAKELNQVGLDKRTGLKVDNSSFGVYNTDLFTDETIRIINNHNQSIPLNVHVWYSAPHAGNADDPLQAPQEAIDQFSYIDDIYRRIYCAMVWKLDEGVGKIIEALQKVGMLGNTIINFMSDNGGTRSPIENNNGSNHPLKGEKSTLYEGGVRLLGVIWAPELNNSGNSGKVIDDNIHVADILPTLYRAAGGDPTQLKNISGKDLWYNIVNGSRFDRGSFPVNIDPLLGLYAVIKGVYKYVEVGSFLQQQEGHYGRVPTVDHYRADEVLNSPTARALAPLTNKPTTEATIKKQREDLRVKCNSNNTITNCTVVKPCCFNIKKDPCENNNIIEQEPQKCAELKKKLDYYKAQAAPPQLLLFDYLSADPKRFDNVWTNFGDYNPFPLPP